MKIIESPTSALIDGDSLSSFLGVSYRNSQAFEVLLQQLKHKHYPRSQLVAQLKKYNISIGNDAFAFDHIDSLVNPSKYCVVTGQQLGMMTGPLYMILKGITCLLIAKETNSIPVFWLATEDHDIAEIDRTYLLDHKGNLEQYHLSFPKDGRPVEDLELSEKNIEILLKFAKAVNLKIQGNDISVSYCQTMAHFLAKLFAGTGMVFLEPKLLRPLAKDFWEKEIKECVKIKKILEKTTSELINSGGKPILNFEKGTNLFLKVDGRRLRLSLEGELFKAGSNTYSKNDLFNLIKTNPEYFSTDVAARPVLQSLLLPTLAYVAGPTEIEYHRQLGDYFKFHQAVMPCILPRLSATLIPPYAADILNKCGLNPWDEIPQNWRELMPELATEEALNAYLEKQNIPSNGLHLLRNLLHPHEKLQERFLNWHGFQAKAKENLIIECLKLLSRRTDRHQYIYFL